MHQIKRRIRRHRRYGSGTSLESITALKLGDYVVHLEHGVGIYRGIETISVAESTIEVAVIEYEGGDRLNVPLYRIDPVSQGISTEAGPRRPEVISWKARATVVGALPGYSIRSAHFT